MRVICDIETDDLKPNLIHCIVTKDVDTKEVRTFERPDKNPKEFLEFASNIKTWIGHYFIRFDYWVVLRKFFPQLKIDPLSIIDTVVLSRLFNYSLEGGHGLEAWGNRFKRPKPKIQDFSNVSSEEILNRCIEDVEINYLLWKKVEKFLDRYKKAIELEHKFEFVCINMQENGFPFDYKKAIEIRNEIDNRLVELDLLISNGFKPKSKLIKEITPVSTKKGALSLVNFKWLGENPDLTPFSEGAPFSLITFEPFNPASPTQIVERLNEAGWKPVEKTKGHIQAERDFKRNRKDTELKERLDKFKVSGWSISEKNLSTLPATAPEGARKLAERIVLASRRSVLTEWINAYNPLTKSIHGVFNGIGSWTHRMSHQNPNQANIPSNPDIKDKNNITPVEQIQTEYGLPLRSLFGVKPGERLIGVDADGIQLRILAHYMEDEEFTNALVSGDKSLGTDVHSLNAIKLSIGRERRDAAKTLNTIEVYKTVKFSETLLQRQY